MINRINSFIKLTRAYALPMSIFSWFVAFCFGVINAGNTIYGIIALAGICFAHIGSNLFDDYIDYHLLPKDVDENNNPILVNAQKGKCEQLLNAYISTKQILALSLFFFILALIIGGYFVLKVGFGVIPFIILSGIIGLLYPILGRFRLCELAIAMIYGPILFGGVFYVMKGYYDPRTLIVCIPTMIMTVNLLYTDTMLDYDIDKEENKKTLANYFPTKWDGLTFHKFLLGAAYASVTLTAIARIGSWEIFLTLGTIPLAINLLDSMKIFIIDNKEIPQRKAYEGPMENWDEIMNEGSAAFMLRMYQARNLMICFSLIFGIALLFKA